MLNQSYVTPIHSLNYKNSKNTIYIKRDDLIPFSFGGNKVRIAEQYFKDMRRKKCNCIIAYGNSRSNLSRVIANMSKVKGLPCYVISPSDDSGERVETSNSKIVRSLGANIIECDKKNVSQTVENVIADCKKNGLNPYYIYGNIYGKGNEKTAVQAYVEAYEEIKSYEKINNISFDYIFHASGTGMTQAGLISGKLLKGDIRNIIGISIARNKEIGSKVIANNILEYLNDKGNLLSEDDIIFNDKYVLDGYGKYNEKIVKIIKDVLSENGVPLDTTYTGKAFWGMTQYLKEKSIDGRKILFIHTGGTPLFFDQLETLSSNERGTDL